MTAAYLVSRYSRVFGLTVLADCAIPGLAMLADTSPPDMEIRLQPGRSWLADEGKSLQQLCFVSPFLEGNEPGVSVYTAQDRSWYRLRYSDGTELLVAADGTRISAMWLEPATLVDTATYLLGPVIGFALRLQGITCLHASAVVVDGCAVAFLGDAGAGKSTTAALLCGAGHPVLTDDIAALDDRGTQFYVQPGYPRLRLWEDSVASLFGSPDALPRITPTWDKRHLDVTEQFCSQPAPLAAIYILDNSGAAPVHIEPVLPHAALMKLVANTTVNYLLDKSMRAREFETLTRVVSHVPVKRLIYNRHSVTGGALSAALRNDLAQEA